MAATTIALQSYLAELATSPLSTWADFEPWQITLGSQAVVRALLEDLDPSEYVIDSEIAVHKRAVVESGAVLKGPLILGSGVFVAASAYLRGGNWVRRALHHRDRAASSSHRSCSPAPSSLTSTRRRFHPRLGRQPRGRQRGLQLPQRAKQQGDPRPHLRHLARNWRRQVWCRHRRRQPHRRQRGRCTGRAADAWIDCSPGGFAGRRARGGAMSELIRVPAAERQLTAARFPGPGRGSVRARVVRQH